MSIEVKNLEVKYGKRVILKDINLEIDSNEVLTILGPNGAGKTTFLNTLAGMLKQSKGEICYNGKSQKHTGIRELASIIGYVPQTIKTTFDFSVLEYVVTGCAPQIGTFSRPSQKHYEEAMSAMEQMGISHLSDHSYKRISGGERQQVAIARVLAQKPAYILMDEPTSHLDYGNQIKVLKLIKELKKNGYGVIFTTHNPDHALLLNGRVAVVDRKGNMSVGNTSEIINEKFLSNLYETKLCIESLGDSTRSICYCPNL